MGINFDSAISFVPEAAVCVVVVGVCVRQGHFRGGILSINKRAVFVHPRKKSPMESPAEFMAALASAPPVITRKR